MNKDNFRNSSKTCNTKNKSRNGKFCLLIFILALGFVAAFACMTIIDTENADAKKFTIDGICYETTAKKKVKVVGCNGLEDMDIPSTIKYKGKNYQITSINKYAFWCNTSLKSVTIGDSVNSVGIYAFDGCTSLKSVTIGNNVTSIGKCAFMDCESLTSMTIPDKVEYLGESAFEYCASLKSVNIPDGVKIIQCDTFKDCTSLESITIPDKIITIDRHAFWKCTSLTSVAIPDSITSIGAYAFYKCTSMTSVTIGKCVKSIDDHAFYGCTKLTNISILGTENNILICETSFKNCKELQNIYVPNVKYDDYKDDIYWSSLKCYLRPASQAIEQNTPNCQIQALIGTSTCTL